jgi:hypothetical protein
MKPKQYLIIERTKLAKQALLRGESIESINILAIALRM